MARDLSGMSRLAGIAAAILATAFPGHAQEIVYTGSVQLASGRYYFAERTNTVYLFNGMSVSTGRIGVSANVPIVFQSTPWVSYTGGGMVPSGGAEHGSLRGRMNDHRGRGPISLPDTTTYSDAGIGDPVVRLELQLVREGDVAPAVRLTADVKPPLADLDSGFGTGEWDYAGGVSVSRMFGATFVFLDGSYWILGDLPDLKLQDALAYSASIGRALGDGKWGVLASVSGYSTIIEGLDPPLQLALGINHRIGTGRSLSASLAFGLTESSPDVSLSVGWRLPLSRS